MLIKPSFVFYFMFKHKFDKYRDLRWPLETSWRATWPVNWTILKYNRKYKQPTIGVHSLQLEVSSL